MGINIHGKYGFLDEKLSHDGIRAANKIFQIANKFPFLIHGNITELNFASPHWSNLHKGRYRINKGLLFKSIRFGEYIYYLLRYSVIFLYNFTNEALTAIIVNKKVTDNIKTKILVFCDVKNCSVLDDVFVYRHIGLLDNSNNSNFIYVVSLLNKNETRFNSVFSCIKSYNRYKKFDNVIFLESYKNIKSIVLSYFWFKRIIQTKEDFQKAGFESLYPKFYSEYNLCDRPKHLSTLRSVTHLTVSLQFTKALVPIFELIYYRTIVSSLRKKGIFVYGLQDGSMGIWHLWRFVYSIAELNKNFSSSVPNKILVEGELMKDLYSHFGVDNASVIGAPRISSISHYKHNKRESNTVLVLLNLHAWEDLFFGAVSMANANSEYRFCIKAHPRSSFSVKKMSVSYNSRNFEIVSGANLMSNLVKISPNLIFASETGALVELALGGWPCIIVKSKKRPILNALSLDCDCIKYVYANEEIEISNLISEIDGLQYGENLRHCGEKQIKYFGQKALTNLMGELNSE
jgi:hypothetical protein